MSRLNLLLDNGFEYHHTATERGYVSRKKKYIIKPYVGRFGIGVKVYFPRKDSTRFVYISYYIWNPKKLQNPKVSVYTTDGIFTSYYQINDYKIGKYCNELYLSCGGCILLPKKTYEIRLKEWEDICD